MSEHAVFKRFQGSEEDVPESWTPVEWREGEFADPGFAYDEGQRALVVGPELDRKRLQLEVGVGAWAAQGVTGELKMLLEVLRPGDLAWRTYPMGRAVLAGEAPCVARVRVLDEVRAGTRFRVRVKAQVETAGNGPWFAVDDGVWWVVSL